MFQLFGFRCLPAMCSSFRLQQNNSKHVRKNSSKLCVLKNRVEIPGFQEQLTVFCEFQGKP